MQENYSNPFMEYILNGTADVRLFIGEAKRTNPSLNEEETAEQLSCLMGPVEQSRERRELSTVLGRCFAHIRETLEIKYDRELFLEYVVAICTCRCPMDVRLVLDVMRGKISAKNFGVARGTDATYLKNLDDSLNKFLEDSILKNASAMDIGICAEYCFDLANANKKRGVRRHNDLTEFGFRFAAKAQFKSFHERRAFTNTFLEKVLGNFVQIFE